MDLGDSDRLDNGAEAADPQDYLPQSMRDKWVVVPRDSLYQLVLVGALLGAGTALSIVGFIQGNRYLWYAFPLAIALAVLQRWLLPWTDRTP